MKWTVYKRGRISHDSSELHLFNGQLQGTQIIVEKAIEEFMRNHI